MTEDYETIEVLFRRSTPKAVCVTSEEGGKEVWLPVSLCIFESPTDDLNINDTFTLSAPEWLLTREGLL